VIGRWRFLPKPAVRPVPRAAEGWAGTLLQEHCFENSWIGARDDIFHQEADFLLLPPWPSWASVLASGEEASDVNASGGIVFWTAFFEPGRWTRRKARVWLLGGGGGLLGRGLALTPPGHDRLEGRVTQSLGTGGREKGWFCSVKLGNQQIC